MDRCPFKQFETWFEEAKKVEKGVESNMMAITTIGLDGYPNSRYVLLKGVHDGAFVFFTNYQSEKGREIEKCPKGHMLFIWPSKSWSVRIKGDIEKSSPEESDAYFKSRPLASQAAAACSKQSQVMADDKTEWVGYRLNRLKACRKCWKRQREVRSSSRDLSIGVDIE
jgi:pyridoxamine 5'-phosphate oxidase